MNISTRSFFFVSTSGVYYATRFDVFFMRGWHRFWEVAIIVREGARWKLTVSCVESGVN